MEKDIFSAMIANKHYVVIKDKYTMPQVKCWRTSMHAITSIDGPMMALHCHENKSFRTWEIHSTVYKSKSHLGTCILGSSEI
jgi:hypothetical protein